MRVLLAVVAALMVAAPSSAGPGNGSDPSAGANVLFVHVDADSGDMWLSNAATEANTWDGGWGSSNPGVGVDGMPALRFDIPLDPKPAKDIRLDPEGTVDIQVVLASYEFHGVPATVFSVTAEAWVTVDGAVLAAGEASGGAVVVGGGAVRMEWEIAPGLDVIPAGADVRLHIDVYGAYTNLYLWLATPPGRTLVSLPVVADPVDERGDGGPGLATMTAPTPTNTTTAPGRTDDGTPAPVHTDRPQSSVPGLPLLAAAMGIASLALARRRP